MGILKHNVVWNRLMKGSGAAAGPSDMLEVRE
jgi:hypothetical protein